MQRSAKEGVKYVVACKCKAKIPVALNSFGHPIVCRSCGITMKVGWGKHPRTHKKIPIAVSMPAKRAGVEVDKTPVTASCTCGYSRPIADEPGKTMPRCPGCGNRMYLATSARKEVRIQVTPGTQSVECPCGLRLILGPELEERAIDCPECRHRVIVEYQAFKPQTITTRPGRTVPPGSPFRRPSREPGPGEFACECGAIIPPRTSRTGPSFTCSSCGRKGHVEQEQDPETRSFKLRPVFDDSSS